MSIHEVFAYLRLKDAKRAIEFYGQAFGAQEQFRLCDPTGRIGHAQLSFGASTIMLSDEHPELGLRGPQSLGGTTVSIHLHVDDTDQTIARAVAAGAEVVRPAKDMFWGERMGVVRDPFGHEWLIGHNTESVSTDEMQQRYTKLAGGRPPIPGSS